MRPDVEALDDADLGLEYGVLELVEVPPTWSSLGAELAADVGDVLGSIVAQVEHIGSTVVPGLPAKPIIDLAIGFADASDVGRIGEPMVDRGWIYGGDAGEDGGHVWILESRPAFRVAQPGSPKCR